MIRYAAFIITLYCITRSKANAFPTVAGHCSAGDAIKYGHGFSGSGILSYGGFKLLVDGVPISRGSTTTLDMQVNHTLTLFGSRFEFKGFMFRMSKDDMDVSSALSVIDNANSRTNPQCTGSNSNVASICHNHNQIKESVDLLLRFDTPIDLFLDLTVVRDNTGGGSNMWYHNSYNFVMQENSPSTAPPTISMKPSDEPTEDPDSVFFYKKKKTGEIITHTCAWLRNKKKQKKHKICTLPKYNNAVEGYGTASQLCVDTCKPYQCRPDKNTTKFVWKLKKSKTVLKFCSWLREQNSKKKEKACKSSLSSGKDPTASEVCFDTCCEQRLAVG